jgi:hypothetical protein
LALGCWHGEPAEEIQADAGGIQDRRNYPTSSKASGISGVISSVPNLLHYRYSTVPEKSGFR